LASRKEAHAILESPEEVAAHAVALAQMGINFAGRHVQVETLCLHGDNIQAAQNARLVGEALLKNGIEIKAM